MKTRTFNSKRIKIRPLSSKDLKFPKKFQDFINSLVAEDAQININKKRTLKEEVKWLRDNLEQVKKHGKIFLVAEDNNIIVGEAEIALGRGRKRHVGTFGITIRKGYRGIGLGTYIMVEIIKLAKKELRPKPKIIKLGVFPSNKPALTLYKKFGFKKVAEIPHQLEYKGKLRNEIIMLLYL